MNNVEYQEKAVSFVLTLLGRRAGLPSARNSPTGLLLSLHHERRELVPMNRAPVHLLPF